jgi:hypothetical protein
VPTLSPAEKSAVLPVLARLRHDLGKYVALQLRSLPADAPDAEILAALRADVLETRKGPTGSVDALGLWDPVAPALAGQADLDDGLRVDLRGHPELDRLTAAMDRLRSAVGPIRSGTATHDLLTDAADAARTASDAVRALHRWAGE